MSRNSRSSKLRLMTAILAVAGLLVVGGCRASAARKVDSAEAAAIALKKAQGKATPEEEKALRHHIDAEETNEAERK